MIRLYQILMKDPAASCRVSSGLNKDLVVIARSTSTKLSTGSTTKQSKNERLLHFVRNDTGGLREPGSKLEGIIELK